MTRTADPYDKLAAMFLTEDDRPELERPVDGTDGIELLVVGHLPVRAAIWLSPYADTIAKRVGTVALIRLDGDEPTIQIRSVAGVRPAPAALPPTADCRNLREAIMLLAPTVNTWIVRPGTNADAETLLGSQERGVPDRITILSSADQAAVTNVYKLVKELVCAARAMARVVPRLGLVMIGSTPERAAEPARRIDQTAREHLDVSVPLVLNMQQIGAPTSTDLRSFPGQRRPALAEVLAWIGTARRSTPASTPSLTPSSTRAEPPVLAPVRGMAKPDAMTAGFTRSLAHGAPEIVTVPTPLRTIPPRAPDARPAAAPPIASSGHMPPLAPTGSPPPPLSPSPATPSAPPTRIVPESEAPEIEDLIRGATGRATDSPTTPSTNRSAGMFGGPRAKKPPRAVTELEPKQAALPREPDHAGQPVALAEHVVDPHVRSEPGAAPTHLKPLVARRPGHERIELALDAAGCVHILSREADLRGLPVVQTWARANRELIAMAYPSEVFDPRAPAVCHVFAAEPLRVADLHATGIHLHVLAPIDVEGKRAWYSAALNAPGRF